MEKPKVIVTCNSPYNAEYKKGDKFIYNDIEHEVIKRYVDDDHPLKAIDEKGNEQLYHNEDLEVHKI